jgi:hypothetical protein
MRQTALSLNTRDRRIVDECRSEGRRMAREFNGAHILAALDRQLPEQQIMEVLKVGRTAVWRTRTAYLPGGLDFALHDEARAGKPRRYQADAEAQVTAPACSDPPSGAQRWTVALLTEAARRHPQLKTISRETIRRILEKTSSNPGANRWGALASSRPSSADACTGWWTCMLAPTIHASR